MAYSIPSNLEVKTLNLKNKTKKKVKDYKYQHEWNINNGTE
jgi:hypothetical protein